MGKGSNKTIFDPKKLPTYKSIPLKGIVNWVENKNYGKGKKIGKSQSAEYGGNQDVRYQE